ncbi:hypothetical protein JW835_11450 [bacterium]|nr:hypothetical protein [bacterium]
MIRQWDSTGLDVQKFDEIFEQFKLSPAMIIDVRMNSGGESLLADAVAERFADQVRLFLYSRRRNGPDHDDLTDLSREYIQPRGPWPFHRPVAVLCGRTCASSTEHFINAMHELPHVTSIGDTTAGAKGNPAPFYFQDGTTYYIPRFIYYTVDMTVVEWNGICPDILVKSTEADFYAKIDPVLDFAIHWANENKAPVTPESTPAVEPDTIPPAVVSTFPENGCQNVDPGIKEIRIVFNEMMYTGGYSWMKDPQNPWMFPEVTADPYYTDDFTHVLPVRLAPEQTYILWMNRGDFLSFRDIADNPLIPYQLIFKTMSDSSGL